MPCGRRQSVRSVWVLSFLMVASQVTELLSFSAATYTRIAHVTVPAPAARFRSLAGMWHSGAHHYSTYTRLGVRRRSKVAWENGVHCRGKTRMNVGGGGGGGGGPRPKKRALGLLSTGVNDAILEMCVENKGRPLARALTDFVEYTIEALASGERPVEVLLTASDCMYCRKVKVCTPVQHRACHPLRYKQ